MMVEEGEGEGEVPMSISSAGEVEGSLDIVQATLTYLCAVQLK